MVVAVVVIIVGVARTRLRWLIIIVRRVKSRPKISVSDGRRMIRLVFCGKTRE
jgi:hypothetical protein